MTLRQKADTLCVQLGLSPQLPIIDLLSHTEQQLGIAAENEHLDLGQRMDKCLETLVGVKPSAAGAVPPVVQPELVEAPVEPVPAEPVPEEPAATAPAEQPVATTFEHQDPSSGRWEPYSAKHNGIISRHMELNKGFGFVSLPDCTFQIRWGGAATSDRMPEPPATGMIQVTLVPSSMSIRPPPTLAASSL